MKKSELQLAQLTEYLQDEQRLKLCDATERLGVSESTVRRLFSRMEQMGQAIRVYGGIALTSEKKRDYSYDVAENRLLKQKKRIAQIAVDEILSVGHIFLDSGSTVYQVSCALAEAVRAGCAAQVQVFTNSLKNLEVLSGVVTVHLIGGRYRENRRDFCGYLSEAALERLHFDLCVLGADGVAIASGLTTTDFETARMNALVVERAQRTVVVADATKFNVSALVSYAQLSQIDRIVTDDSLDELDRRAIRECGVEVDCV